MQAVANCAPGAIERVLKLTRERLTRFAETRGPSAPPSAAGVRFPTGSEQIGNM
jgi:hypothetical protein